MRRWRSARIAHSLLRTRHPKSVMPAEISQRATAPLRAGTPVRILVWNIQYAAGREQHFFYDGGEAVHASTEQVTETVRGITEFLRHADPDILLLQEVDRDSSRTGRLDELEARCEACLAAALETELLRHAEWATRLQAAAVEMARALRQLLPAPTDRGTGRVAAAQQLIEDGRIGDVITALELYREKLRRAVRKNTYILKMMKKNIEKQT